MHAVFVAIMPDAMRSIAGFDADADGVICGENVGGGELTAFAVCRDFGSFFKSDLPAGQAVHRRFRNVRVMALAAHAFHVARKQREKRMIHVDPKNVTVSADAAPSDAGLARNSEGLQRNSNSDVHVSRPRKQASTSEWAARSSAPGSIRGPEQSTPTRRQTVPGDWIAQGIHLPTALPSSVPGSPTGGPVAACPTRTQNPELDAYDPSDEPLEAAVAVADRLRASAAEYIPPAHPGGGDVDFGDDGDGDDAVNLSKTNTPMGVGMPSARTDGTMVPMAARPDVASSTPATGQPGAFGREFGRPPAATDGGGLWQHDCRTEGCFRPTSGPSSLIAVSHPAGQFHCCVLCINTEGRMHDRECGARSVPGGRYRGAAAASNHRDNDGRRIDIPRRMDQTDGACDFHIDEIDSLKPTQRGGKRKGRVAADRIIYGPVGRGTAEAPDNAFRFKGFSIENVMAPPLSSSAFTLAEALVDAMVYELNEDEIVDGGPTQLAFGLHLQYAVTTSDALVAELRSYRAACVAVRQRCIVRHRLNADPNRLGSLDGLVDANLLSYVLKIAREGVNMRADTPSVKHDAGPHQPAANHVVKAYVLSPSAVTAFAALEMWRLQGPSDVEYKRLKKVNPPAGYTELAGAAGDALSTTYAKLGAARLVSRAQMLIKTLARMQRYRVVATLQARFRGRKVRSRISSVVLDTASRVRPRGSGRNPHALDRVWARRSTPDALAAAWQAEHGDALHGREGLRGRLLQSTTSRRMKIRKQAEARISAWILRVKQRRYSSVALQCVAEGTPILARKLHAFALRQTRSMAARVRRAARCEVRKRTVWERHG